MWGRFTVWATCTLLQSVHLSVEQRTMLTGILLDRLHAIPTRDIITKDEGGTMLINGRRLDVQGVIHLRESAARILREPARKLVSEQIQFKAVTLGIHQGMTPEQILFSKACIWQGAERDVLYKELAQGADDPDQELGLT